MNTKKALEIHKGYLSLSMGDIIIIPSPMNINVGIKLSESAKHIPKHNKQKPIDPIICLACSIFVCFVFYT
jgi:hypothetical protein